MQDDKNKRVKQAQAQAEKAAAASFDELKNKRLTSDFSNVKPGRRVMTESDKAKMAATQDSAKKIGRDYPLSTTPEPRKYQ
jgi:hypothetical protein